MNGWSFKRLLKFFRVYWHSSTKASPFSSPILIIILSKQVSPDFDICLPVLVLKGTYFVSCTIEWIYNVDRSSDLIFSKSSLSISVRLCRNSLLPSVICFKSTSFGIYQLISHRVRNNLPVDGRSNIHINSMPFNQFFWSGYIGDL